MPSPRRRGSSLMLTTPAARDRLRLSGARLFVWFAVLLCLAAAIPARPARQWKQLAPFPDPAEELQGIAVGGRLYVFGGMTRGWKPMGLVYEYDPAVDQWTRKKPMLL